MNQCTATNRQGTQCKLPAIPGGTVCRRHGGSAPNVKAAAERRLQLAEAQEACERLSVPIQVDPGEALLNELFRTAGLVYAYEAEVQKLALVEGQHFVDVRHVSGIKTGEAKPHVLVELLFRERQHLTAVSVAALKAGIEERRVRIVEAQAQQLARVVTAICEDFGIDLTDSANREKVRLRLIEGGREATA